MEQSAVWPPRSQGIDSATIFTPVAGIGYENVLPSNLRNSPFEFNLPPHIQPHTFTYSPTEVDSLIKINS